MAIDADWLIPNEDISTDDAVTWSDDPLSVFTGLPDKDQSSEIFYKKVPGRLNNVYDVDCKISPQGDLKELEGIDVIVKSAITLFMISPNTYLMDPQLGIGIYKYLWEDATDELRQKIENACNEAFRKYEDRANITVKVDFYRDRHAIRIDCTFDFKGERKEITIDVDDTFLRTLE